MCARVLARWGGQLGRGALLAQVQLELNGGDRSRVGGPLAGGSALERALDGGPREPNAVHCPFDLLIVSTELVAGPGVPLVLATVREADRDERAAATAVLALPERLCALARSPGLSTLVAAGRTLRLAGPLVSFGRGVVEIAPPSACLPVLSGSDEQDDLFAMCSVTHALGEIDRAALERGLVCTLLCRISDLELSPALARALGEPPGSPACAPLASAPPVHVPSDEPLWARVLLADAAETAGVSPGACAELLLVGAEAFAAGCLAPRPAALARGLRGASAGALVLLHNPFVQRPHGAAGGEGMLLRLGSGTLIAPIDEAAAAEPAAAAPPPRAAAAAVSRPSAERSRALLGACVPAGPAGLDWQCPTAGGRVRCTLELRMSQHVVLGLVQPLSERASAAQRDTATAHARVCAPAKAFARLRVPRARIDAVEPSATGWCVLAVVQLPHAECGGADSSAGPCVTAAQLNGAPSCQCAECEVERALGGPSSIRAEELFLFAPPE
jgi:hypothetical protein